MDTCRVAIVFTIYMMAVLISAHCFVAESVAEDVAAIPPTPMESGGGHLGAPDAFVVIAFVEVSKKMAKNYQKKRKKMAKDLGQIA
ncbi:hypothetical protein RJT34_03995 [Clitoria ternatea]|uniref:Uncharacterized protein n=1 Tax=Clitoria ternatea TaxID=43366 RepID=A0AAN9KLR6_CLITE